VIGRQIQQLLEHSRYILTHPQASPRETVTLAAIFVVLVLAALAFLSLFFTGQKRQDDEDELDRDSEPRHFSIALDVGVVGGVVVLSLAVLMIFFSNLSRSPGYCKSCHEMKNDYRSWARSSHGRFECANCHQSPGFFGYSLYRIRQLEMLLHRMDGSYEKPISAQVENASCLQCHVKETSGSIVVAGLKMRHKDVLDAGYRCVTCHNTAGHGAAVLNAKLPSMHLCSSCHNGQTAFSTCSRCHLVDIGKNIRRKSSFPAVSLGPVTTCRGCHSIGKCNECHGLELPHPPGWLGEGYDHARAAAFERKTLCEHCHSKQFCAYCHKTDNFDTHGPNWKAEHGGNGDPARQEGCLSCHKPARNFCGICHERYRNVYAPPRKGEPVQPEVPKGAKTF